MSDSQERAQLIERLEAIRRKAAALSKDLSALPGDIQHTLIPCFAKLDALDALLTMEIDELKGKA